MQSNKLEIRVKGKPVFVDTVEVNGIDLIITGNFMKICKLKEEWYQDLQDAQSLIETLKITFPKPDIFTFWQRLPDTTPNYPYYMEWEPVSALHIKSFDHWWKNQLTSAARNKAKKAGKKGVEIKEVIFSDELVKGIMNIHNETPVRRGKPFWHYGKDFDTVKNEWSRDSSRSSFIGAYFEGSLIGYIKLVFGERVAEQVQNISMLKHRNKYPINALISKAVEICANKNIPYLTYGAWRRGTHADFLRRNGFEKFFLPRYYVPLTFKGKLFIQLRLHRGMRGLLPENILNQLLALREKWYEKK